MQAAAKGTGRPVPSSPAAPTPSPAFTSDKDRVAGSSTRQRLIYYPFWFGGSSSSMAACVTHPLDLGKPPPRAALQVESTLR